MISAIEQRFTRINSTNCQRPGESRDQFYCRLLRESEEKLEEADAAAVLSAKSSGNSIKLTDEQAAYLSGKYNAQDMSQEEYEALLEDLQRLDLVSSEESGILRYSAPSRLNGIWAAPDVNGLDISHRFEGGNLFDWSRFRASFESCAQDGITYYRDQTSLLFEKLYSILEQM